MGNPGSPTVRRRRLGALLREARKEAGLSKEEVAAQLDFSLSAVTRWETGTNGIRVRDLRVLMDVLNIEDEPLREHMQLLAREGRKRGWWSKHASVLRPSFSTYVGLEADAHEVDIFSCLVVPGLLQTSDYARAVIRAGEPPLGEDAVERRLNVRLQRQERVNRAQNPLLVHAILDEGSIRRLIGGAETWLGQMKHLQVLAQRYSITIQVVPFEAGAHASVLSNFSLLHFDGGDLVGYTELPDGDLFAEGPDALRYFGMFNDLRAQALSPAESLKMIERVLAQGSATC